VRDDTRIVTKESAPHPTNLDITSANVGVDPEAAADDTVAADGNDGGKESRANGDSAARDQEAAEILVSIRNARIKEKQGLPESSPPAKQSSNTSKPLTTTSSTEHHPRTIEFVSGGVIPGTFPEGISDDNSKAAPTYSQPGKESAAKGDATPKEPAGDTKVRIETLDVDMDSSDESTDDTLPQLYHPNSDSEDSSASEDISISEEKDDHTPGLPTPTSPIIGTPPPNSVTGIIPHGTGVGYRVWQDNLEEMKKLIRKGATLSSLGIRDIFGKMGMLQWWFALEFLYAKDVNMDWLAWKNRVVGIWTKRYPQALPMVFRWMANDVEDLDNERRKYILSTTGKDKGKPDEDVEMGEPDAPEDPKSSPTPSRNFSPSPTKPANDQGPVESFVAYAAFEALKAKVGEVEKRAQETTRDL
jgi:hypothetical protein